MEPLSKPAESLLDWIWIHRNDAKLINPVAFHDVRKDLSFSSYDELSKALKELMSHSLNPGIRGSVPGPQGYFEIIEREGQNWEEYERRKETMPDNG